MKMQISESILYQSCFFLVLLISNNETRLFCHVTMQFLYNICRYVPIQCALIIKYLLCKCTQQELKYRIKFNKKKFTSTKFRRRVITICLRTQPSSSNVVMLVVQYLTLLLLNHVICFNVVAYCISQVIILFILTRLICLFLKEKAPC